MQHHEQPNGRGYPNGILGTKNFQSAKIVAISDSFTALVSRRAFRPPFTPLKAVEVMKEDHGKFDLDLLEKFAGLFAPSGEVKDE